MDEPRRVVFVSYARGDDRTGSLKSLIIQLREEIARLAVAVEVFADDQVEPGSSWPDVLRQKLEMATVLVPILTPTYFASEFCRGELSAFLDQGRAIVPVLFADVPQLQHDPVGDLLISQAAKIAWIDFRGRERDASLVAVLAASIVRVLSKPQPATTPAAASPAASM